MPQTTTSAEGRDLILTREIAAPPAAVYRAWTDPALLTRWFAPLPWTTPHAELDLRPGGSSLVTMRSPEGADFPNRGVFLEVIPNQRLVLTDAYTSAWEPSEKPFMTVILTFDPLPNTNANAPTDLSANATRTRYTARVRHWSLADREAHETMGFHTGWPLCTEQLAKLVEPT